MKNSIVIMAGGQGTRLKRKINNLPKSLAPIGNKTILEYQIEHLKKYKDIDLHFCLGYKSHQILKLLESLEIEFTFSIEEKPLGTYGALYNSKDYLNRNFFVLYGDVLTNFDINFGFDKFKKLEADFLLISRFTDHPLDSDLIKFNNKNQVTDIFRVNEDTYNYSPVGNTGLFYGKKSCLNINITSNKPDIFKDFIKGNLDKYKVKTIMSNSYIKDVGTEERYEKETKNIDNYLNTKKNIIFLDRDETIIENNEKNSIEDLKFKKGALDLIKKLQKNNYSIFLITNQPGVAKGFCSLEDVKRFHNHIQLFLISNGLKPFDQIKFCPHHPKKGYPKELKEMKITCKCRKPDSEMVNEVLNEFNISGEQNFKFIGDTITDYYLSQNFNSDFYMIKSCFTDINKTKKNNLKIYNTLKEIEDIL
jgi:mannose-1-phosphate guanylyltransferase / phosphomannomutase